MRGKAHSAALRAKAVSEVVAGETVHTVAKRHGIPYQTVQHWVSEDGPIEGPNARTREELGRLVYDYAASLLRATTAIADHVDTPGWLEQQSAADLASLASALGDRAIRMVSGLRPAEDQPALPDGD